MKFHGKHSNAFNFIYERYVFRFNVVTNEYEFRKSNKKKWKKYEDRHRKTILMQLMKDLIEVPTDKVDIFIESKDCSPDYNPFVEYFENLKPHKSKRDYIGEMAETIKTNKPEHFKKTFEKFLVGTIDCLLRRDAVNDVCLVFQSPQGIGKTRWMRRLLPKQLRSEYLYEGNIDTRDKDHVMYLSQYWFIHLDELETLRNNDIGAIKSYITRQRISVRKSYGRYKTNMVRRASFLGSVNEDKFLSDITGNRRWLVFKVSDIDYMHKINSDDVWAQAYKLWKKGHRHWFDIDEIRDINNENEKFRTVAMEEELLLRYFDFPSKKSKSDMLSSSEVIEQITLNIPSFSSKMGAIAMGKALSKHSNIKEMKGGIQRYALKYKGPETHEKPFKESKTINEGDDVPF